MKEKPPPYLHEAYFLLNWSHMIYSFRCGIDYHAPTSCDIIKKWLTKCIDDSETANYISANTKDVSVSLIYIKHE